MNSSASTSIQRDVVSLQWWQFLRRTEVPKEIPKIEEELSYCYDPTRYCRVRIGDTVGNGRFQILGKLGWGQFSTVWFANDTE